MQHPVPSVFNRTMKIFMNTEKSKGDKILPCLTPLLTKKLLERNPFHLTTIMSLLYQLISRASIFFRNASVTN